MKVKIFRVLVVGIFMCNINPVSFAQEEEPILYEDEYVSEELVEAEEYVAGIEDELYGEGIEAEEDALANVTLIFKDADIRTVLHTLSYKSGVNIVAASDVEGKVNIRLVDVPWETALEVIIKNQGLSYEKVGNIIRVVTLESVAVEELQNEIFVLNYSKAKDVASAIEDTLTERGKVKYDERTNTLIITDIPTNLYKVRKVIERLDSRTPQIAIEAKIIETTLDKDENMGIAWNLEATASGSGIPTTLPFKRIGSLVSGRQTDASSIYRPLGDPDSEPPFPSTTIPSFPYIDASAFTFGTLDFSEMSAALEILNQRTDTKIISNPNITTLDNQQAMVKVTTVFNIPTYERNESTGSMEVTGYTEKDVGIILTVTPHVNQAGDIVVDLKPEVSAFVQWDTFGTGGNTIFAPRFRTRTAETQVMVKDGQTIVIGGMISETTTKVRRKVPILGDIPILGELFKKTEDGIETTDLLIFVTVRLLKEDIDDASLMSETEQKAIHDADDVVQFEEQYTREED